MNITVFGTPNCSNCKTVISFLEAKELTYEYKTIGKDVSKDQLEEDLGRYVRTVPVIVVGNEELSFEALKIKFSTMS